MAKFTPDKWKPTDDSSMGYRTLDPRCVVLKVSLTEEGALGCPCGCGDFPASTKTTFCMGHDARLRGILVRCHLMGVQIRYYAGGVLGDPSDAMALARMHYWTSYLEEAVMKREGRNREVLAKALESERLVKVGRWEYTGQVVAVYRLKNVDMFELEYVDKAGNIKHTRVPADETKDPLEAVA